MAYFLWIFLENVVISIKLPDRSTKMLGLQKQTQVCTGKCKLNLRLVFYLILKLRLVLQLTHFFVILLYYISHQSYNIIKPSSTKQQHFCCKKGGCHENIHPIGPFPIHILPDDFP